MKENTVYIGRKPVMTYVMAIITAMNNPDHDLVLVKARGRSISTAVDAVEVTRTRYIPNIETSIAIGTEEMDKGEAGERKVSTIDITLRKSPEAV